MATSTNIALYQTVDDAPIVSVILNRVLAQARDNKANGRGRSRPFTQFKRNRPPFSRDVNPSLKRIIVVARHAPRNDDWNVVRKDLMNVLVGVGVQRLTDSYILIICTGGNNCFGCSPSLYDGPMDVSNRAGAFFD